jgi:hypothetical protein
VKQPKRPEESQTVLCEDELRDELGFAYWRYLANRLGYLRKRLQASDATSIALAVLVGLLAGLGAVLFRWMIRGFQRIFFGQGAEWLGFVGHN